VIDAGLCSADLSTS